MKFERGYPTILIVHLLDLPTEPIPLHHIVIKLIPPRRGCELGPWKFGEWGEIKTVDEAVEGVKRCEEGSGGDEGRIHLCVRSDAAQS